MVGHNSNEGLIFTREKFGGFWDVEERVFVGEKVSVFKIVLLLLNSFILSDATPLRYI